MNTTDWIFPAPNSWIFRIAINKWKRFGVIEPMDMDGAFMLSLRSVVSQFEFDAEQKKPLTGAKICAAD